MADLLTSGDFAALGLTQLAKAKQSESGSAALTLENIQGTIR